MMRGRASIQRLSGDRLHLSDGPIDVVIGVFGTPDARHAAFRAAADRFETVLDELCAELPLLRAEVRQTGPRPQSPVGRRMLAACGPFADVFVTPMAAVAGSVADQLLAVMLRAAPLERAYVNDGGDIAVHAGAGQSLLVGLAGAGGFTPVLGGSVLVRGGEGIGGVATSGRGGRSFSLGIADAVTVLAADAATADVAATLIANAVDVADAPIRRRPARELDPDSDLLDLPVVVEVGPLDAGQIAKALDAGRLRALEYVERGLVLGAALALGGQVETVGRAPLGQLERKAS